MTHKMSQSGSQGVASGRYPPSYLEYLSLWDLKNTAHVESFGKFVCVFVIVFVVVFVFVFVFLVDIWLQL